MLALLTDLVTDELCAVLHTLKSGKFEFSLDFIHAEDTPIFEDDGISIHTDSPLFSPQICYGALSSRSGSVRYCMNQHTAHIFEHRH